MKGFNDMKALENLRSSGLRTRPITIMVNGKRIEAYDGETVLAALSAAGFMVLRESKMGASRGAFCGMGVCYECLVTIDGKPQQRACMTPVRDGMEIIIDEK
ncbi:MAG: (2Fe-2S)-binding protein [Desulfatiglandaceae bacterium]